MKVYLAPLPTDVSGGYFEQTLSQSASDILNPSFTPPPNQECQPRYNFKLNNENVYLLNFINVDPEQIPHYALFGQMSTLH